MTEPIQTVYETDLADTTFEDNDLPTANLRTGQLTLTTASLSESGAPPHNRASTIGDQTDWLALLAAKPAETEPLEDELPPVEPQPAGMSEHAAPPVIKPTLWARFVNAVRRLSMLGIVIALTCVVAGAGAYVIVSTGWLDAALYGPARAPATSVPPAQQPNSKQSSPSQGDTAASQGIDPQISGGATAGELRERGVASYRAGEYSQAAEDLEASIQRGGGDAVTYYQLGLAYLAGPQGDHATDDAELAFRSAIALQPDWAAPYQLLAETMIRGGYYSEAVSFAEKSTQLDPQQPEAWLTLARAYEGAGKAAEARTAYAEAARLAPQPPAAP